MENLLTSVERLILLNLLHHTEEVHARWGRTFLGRTLLQENSLDLVFQSVDLAVLREKLREAAHFCGRQVCSDYSIAHPDIAQADLEEFSLIVCIAQGYPQYYNVAHPDWFHDWELLHYFADRLCD